MLVNSRNGPNLGLAQRRAIHGDPRSCGRVARILINAVLPMLFVIAATGILLYVDPIVTIWLCLLVAIAAPFFYWTNVRGGTFFSTHGADLCARGAREASTYRR